MLTKIKKILDKQLVNKYYINVNIIKRGEIMADTSTIAFRVDPELHRALKVYLASRGQSLGSYFTAKIENDLNREAQNTTAQQETREELRNCAIALQDQIQRLTSLLEQQF